MAKKPNKYSLNSNECEMMGYVLKNTSRQFGVNSVTYEEAAAIIYSYQKYRDKGEIETMINNSVGLAGRNIKFQPKTC